MSQRARILWVIVLAITPLAVLSGAMLWQQMRQSEERIAAERLQLARAIAFATEAFLEGHVAAARTVATHPAVAAARPGPELNAVLKEFAVAHPDWEGVGVVGADGQSVGGS